MRADLAERAAPGTTVVSCYHRQVEHAVRTLLLADEPTRAERRRLLADYFDTRWNQPDWGLSIKVVEEIRNRGGITGETRELVSRVRGGGS